MTVRRLGVVGALALGLLLASVAADAQQTTKVPRVGWFGLTTRAGNTDLIEGFRDGLHKLGYEDGKGILIEYRFADGQAERLPGLAAELVRLGVDVVVTSSTPSTIAIKEATRTIPIVMVSIGSPDESGLVASLARPGGNVTGVSGAYGDFAVKWLELVREVAPRASRVGYLYNSANRDIQLRSKHVMGSGQTLGVTVQPFTVTTPAEIEPQLAAMVKARVHAVIVDSDGVLRTRRKETVEFLARARLPAIYGNQDYVDAGGLMSYGPSRPEMARRAAVYVDKILKGAKPADLPVERPTKFELVINMRTANALGVTLPQALLLRTDHLIQ